MRGVSPLEVLLLLVIAAAFGLHFVVYDDLSKRSPEVMPGMVTSPASEAQDPNPLFPDGKTLRTPVAGTIARGLPPYRVGSVRLDGTTPWKDLSAEGKAAWTNYTAPWTGEEPDPVTTTKRLNRGAAVFTSVCATCHGAGGTGLTEVTKRGVPPPPSLLDDQAKGYTDGQLFRHITYGIGNMPAHASQIERLDRWMVILYLRSLQAP